MTVRFSPVMRKPITSLTLVGSLGTRPRSG
jgi:hypothetical protein